MNTLRVEDNHTKEPNEVPVIDLSKAPGERLAWDRPRLVVYLWSIIELLLVANPWQVSSRLRVNALRAFGAQIGNDVIFRPRTRVKFPWKLQIGDRCWIGEGVWFHNQDKILIGHDVVISQESLLTTGSHSIRSDMSLVTSPIEIHDGAWIAARCVVLGGRTVGRSSVVGPNLVVRTDVPANTVVSSSDLRTSTRFQNDDRIS